MLLFDISTAVKQNISKWNSPVHRFSLFLCFASKANKCLQSLLIYIGKLPANSIQSESNHFENVKGFAFSNSIKLDKENISLGNEHFLLNWICLWPSDNTFFTTNVCRTGNIWKICDMLLCNCGKMFLKKYSKEMFEEQVWCWLWSWRSVETYFLFYSSFRAHLWMIRHAKWLRCPRGKEVHDLLFVDTPSDTCSSNVWTTASFVSLCFSGKCAKLYAWASLSFLTFRAT